MFRLLVILCSALAVHSQSTSVSQCTSNPGPLPLNAFIEGCETPPCRLPQQQDAVISIVFRAPRTMTRMTTLATAYLASIIPLVVPYPLGAHSVTCNFLENTYCPVLEGEIVMYTLRLYIEEFFTLGTQANIEFRVNDQNNTPVLCIRLPIVIIEPISPTNTAEGRSNSTILLQPHH